MIFKQLKSVLRVHSSPTTREYRLKCELFGKFIMAVLIHSIHSSLNAQMWSARGLDVSFDKLYKRIRERAWPETPQTLSCCMSLYPNWLAITGSHIWSLAA